MLWTILKIATLKSSFRALIQGAGIIGDSHGKLTSVPKPCWSLQRPLRPGGPAGNLRAGDRCLHGFIGDQDGLRSTVDGDSQEECQ